jgi:ribosome assembly protein 1
MRARNPQTITVLRTVYLSHLRPILVINKLDRLITELKLSPIEAYHHLSRIIEDVNAVVGSFYSSERMEEDLRRHERAQAAAAADVGGEGVESGTATPDEQPFEERDDSGLYFDPAQGNVLFASAIDGWAFRISRFAQLYAAKLGISEKNLNKVLWGDFYLDMKTKRVLSRKKMEASGKKLKPLFVQFILENIWGVYDAISLNKCVSSSLHLLAFSLLILH